MATSYPLPTLAAKVDATGISAPSYPDILASLQASFQAIYGSDAYLNPDSQDGQLVAVFARAIYECNQTAIAVYNSFSPSYAQGVGLSSVVKINGIKRLVPSNSQVNLTITGTIGTTILNGSATDAAKVKWNLPPSVTIPPAGFIVVTATCDQPGAIPAAPGTVTNINTPTLGWQSVTNATAASLGAPVESDAALRARQKQSVALPALTVLAALQGAVAAVTGVTAARVYENDTAATNADGVPAKSIAVVVQGGVALDVATAIMNKKTPGCATFGSTTVNVTDAVGQVQAIKFTVPAIIRIICSITIKGLSGYNSAIGDLIKAAVAAQVSALAIGEDVVFTRLYLAALLQGAPGSETFEIVNVLISAHPAAVAAANVVIAYNAIADLAVGDISLTVT